MSASPIDTSGFAQVVDRPDWLGQRVAVLGDIHGNALAFREAVRGIEQAGITRVCCHGDLLTYGCSPRAVLATLDELVQRFDCVLLAGNHEPFYFEGQAGEDRLFATKRDFIRDSIRWTLERITDVPLQDRYPWRDACTIGDVLISHANPYIERTWRYVNEPDDEVDAAIALVERRARVGVFGHTHRARLTAVSGMNVDRRSLLRPVRLDDGGSTGPRWVLNTGSVGQPRGQGATWLELDLAERAARLHRIRYDVAAHLTAIRRSGLPGATVDRLCDFFALPTS